MALRPLIPPHVHFLTIEKGKNENTVARLLVYLQHAQTDVYFLRTVCVRVCMCNFIYVCIGMYVQLCMCLCDPCSDLFLTAWVLNYSCARTRMCLCARVCVCSVAPVISLLLPAPTPVLQLTCIVQGAASLLTPRHGSFPPSSVFLPLLAPPNPLFLTPFLPATSSYQACTFSYPSSLFL